MRLLLILWLVPVFPPLAGAHTLAGDESLVNQLGHQVSSLHHLPATLVLIVGCVVLSVQSIRKRRS